MREVRKVVGLEGLRSLAEPWRALEGVKPGGGAYYQRFAWYESFLEHLEEDDSAWSFFVAYHGSRAAAILPLRRDVFKFHGLAFKCLRMNTHSHSGLNDAVVGEQGAEVLPDLLEHVRTSSGCSVVWLPQLAESSTLLSARPIPPGPSMLLDFAGHSNELRPAEWDEYKASLSRNFRGNLRKARNRLRDREGVEFVSVHAPRDLEEWLPRFFSVEASGWKGEQGRGSAIALDPALRGFYTSLARAFGEVGCCELNFLMVEGNAIAGQFALLGGDVRYVLKIGFDESEARLAPGNLLLEHVVERSFREVPARAVNLIGSTEWHHLWNPHGTRVFDAFLFGGNWGGRVCHGLMRVHHVARCMRDRLFRRGARVEI